MFGLFEDLCEKRSSVKHCWMMFWWFLVDTSLKGKHSCPLKGPLPLIRNSPKLPLIRLDHDWSYAVDRRSCPRFVKMNAKICSWKPARWNSPQSRAIFHSATIRRTGDAKTSMGCCWKSRWGMLSTHLENCETGFFTLSWRQWRTEPQWKPGAKQLCWMKFT